MPIVDISTIIQSNTTINQINGNTTKKNQRSEQNDC